MKYLVYMYYLISQFQIGFGCQNNETVIKLVPLQILATGLPFFFTHIGPASARANTEKFTILFEYNLTHRDGTAPADTQARCYILFHCNIREYHISNSYNIIQKPIGLAMDVKLCGHYRIIRSGAFNRIVLYIAL